MSWIRAEVLSPQATPPGVKRPSFLDALVLPPHEKGPAAWLVGFRWDLERLFNTKRQGLPPGTPEVADLIMAFDCLLGKDVTSSQVTAATGLLKTRATNTAAPWLSVSSVEWDRNARGRKGPVFLLSGHWCAPPRFELRLCLSAEPAGQPTLPRWEPLKTGSPA